MEETEEWIKWIKAPVNPSMEPHFSITEALTLLSLGHWPAKIQALFSNPEEFYQR